MDALAPGKHVKVRSHKRNGDGERMKGHFVGTVKEVVSENRFILENGWYMHLDLGDILVWCADEPAPPGFDTENWR